MPLLRKMTIAFLLWVGLAAEDEPCNDDVAAECNVNLLQTSFNMGFKSDDETQSGCTNLPGWVSNGKKSCDMWAESDLCADGTYGSGWKANYGTFGGGGTYGSVWKADDAGVTAQDACCVCGRGKDDDTPTATPTATPMSGVTPPLKNLGSSGCSSTTPCIACQGDCDDDSDCAGALQCFQRAAHEQVPGCLMGGDGDVNKYDYCSQAPVCSNVAGAASATYPCKCGTSTASTVTCTTAHTCVAANDNDGVCTAPVAPVCSNVAGAASATYPCTCGTSTASTVTCTTDHTCVASNDNDGVCTRVLTSTKCKKQCAKKNAKKGIAWTKLCANKKCGGCLECAAVFEQEVIDDDHQTDFDFDYDDDGDKEDNVAETS